MKAHLFESDEPVKQGQSYQSLCGKTIAHSLFVFMQDGEFVQMSSIRDVDTRGVCSECMTTPIVKRFLYGLVNGQEWIDYCSKRKTGGELAESA